MILGCLAIVSYIYEAMSCFIPDIGSPMSQSRDKAIVTHDTMAYLKLSARAMGQNW